MKKLSILPIATLLSLSISISAFAGEWKENSIGWWYQNDDGTYPVSTWKQIGDKWYYFASNGYMKTGWLEESDKWYYCEPSGEMRTTDLQTDVFLFKFNTDGSCSNFSENTTPSTQAGWASYNTGSLETLTTNILSGNVIKYKNHYWATPDFLNSLRDEVVHYRDLARTEAEKIGNRFDLIDLEISYDDNETSDDLDGFSSDNSFDDLDGFS